MKAWHLHRLAVRTGELGIPIDVDRPIDEEPAPFVSFAAALEAVSDLLDEAYADLQAGGAAFPFPVAPGFHRLLDAPDVRAVQPRARREGAGAPGDVRRLLRLLGRGAARRSPRRSSPRPASPGRSRWACTTATPAWRASRRTRSPSHLSADRLWVHSSIVTGAQTAAGRNAGPPPDPQGHGRRARCTSSRPDGHAQAGALQHARPTRAGRTPPRDIPWIDNEELLLLRAEIRWHTGDRAGAIADMDLIRQHAGGLGPTAPHGRQLGRRVHRPSCCTTGCTR